MNRPYIITIPRRDGKFFCPGPACPAGQPCGTVPSHPLPIPDSATESYQTYTTCSCDIIQSNKYRLKIQNHDPRKNLNKNKKSYDLDHLSTPDFQ